MEYLKIIEENFTTEEFNAYLRGSILKALLSEQPLVLSEFELYANKLVEVVKEAPADEPPVKIDVFRPVVKSVEETSKQPTVDPDEPRVFKFKLGDHVIVSKGTEDERTGVIVRLPMDGVDCSRSYVVDLDDKDFGWIATVAIDGVDCQNAWVVSENNMELLPTTLQENTTLQANTWYHTTDFTVEVLRKLLPSGTHLQVEKQALYDGIKTTPPTETKPCIVKDITTSVFGDKALIEGVNDGFLREWFKITEEK